MTSDRTRVFAGDWTGAVRVFETDSKKHAMEIFANPPTVESRLEKACAILADVQSKVQVDIDKAKKLDAACILAEKNYEQAVEQLAKVEHNARVASRKIYDLVKLRENDELQDDSNGRTELAASQNNWDQHLKATAAAYNQIIKQLANRKKARAAMKTARATMVESQKKLVNPRMRVQELTSIIEQR